MTFHCDSCSETRDFDLDYGMIILREKETVRICRSCRRPKAFVPDVFWDGKPEENLADDPRTGKARVFSSKSEKAAYLRDRGITEAGDSMHGGPASVQPPPKADSRHEVMMALKHVREMGRDRRRQEYLRITNFTPRPTRPSQER